MHVSSRRTLIVSLLLGGLTLTGLRAQPSAPAAPAAAPAEPAGPTVVPLDMFAVPEGLEVTLWAQSPQLRNPTNMDIDAAGRIWVTEGVNYRRNQTREPAGDRIVVLQDTNGDGVADSSHVFVQEATLIAPLGIAVIDNQIIVSNTPDLIVYTDVDRDLKFDPKIDKREVLLTGFNGRNHDHSLHSVTFGPDGLWYFNHGNSGALFTDRSGQTFRVGHVYDPVRSGGGTPMFGWTPPQLAGARSDDGHVYVGGFSMRMRPDGTRVEVIGHNYRNSYEQAVTSFGDLFQNDNDDSGSCRTSFLLEYGNAGFFSADGVRTWQADRRPGQPAWSAHWRQDDPGVMPAGDVYGGGAPTGIVYYEGDLLGEKWRGLLLSCESARNTVFGYFPKPSGAGYALERFDFLTSNAERDFAGTDFKRGRPSNETKTFFRPSDVTVGPDGALYVADWFDPRVGGHADLDKTTSGAIYRIAPKGFKAGVPALDPSTLEGQLAALRSPAVNVRALGYLRLRERGAAAVPAVAEILKDKNPYVRARAIWLLAELGDAGVARVEALLKDNDAQTRIAAFRSLRRINHKVVSHAQVLARDASAAVRREAALAMRDRPFAEAKDVLLTVAQGYDGKDRTYLEAWGTGATKKEAELFDALMAGAKERDPLKWTPAFAGLVWRLTPEKAVPAFAARARATSLSERERLDAVTALGFIAAPAAPAALIDVAAAGKDAAAQHALWWLLNYKDTRWKGQGLDAALKSRGLYDPANFAAIPSLVPEPAPSQLPPPAQIARLTGDVKRGADKVQSCYLCHKVGGQGNEFGPELTGWASRQSIESTILAMVDPSAEVAHGYDGTELVLHDGTVIHGLVLSGGDPLVVQTSGGLTQFIPSAKVKSRNRLNRSLMLSAEQLGMTAQDVADVVSYLRAP